MKRLIRILIIVAAAVILSLLLILASLSSSNIRPGISVEQEHYDALLALEKKAVQNGDFPIGALILYRDSIIGRGFNTLKYLNDPLGHAEINAIKSVFQSMSYKEFEKLDRENLILMCSFEPCMMCKGTINYHDIRKIYYLNPKKTRYRLKYLRKDFSFNLKTRRIIVPRDQ